MKSTVILIVATTLLWGLPLGALAESSNRGEVRKNLHRGGWKIAWGRVFAEGDWLEGAGAIVASYYSSNPKPFYLWIKLKVRENYVKIRSQIPGIAEDKLVELFEKSVEEGRIVQYKNMRLDAGFATYNRWKEWTHPSLDTSSWPPKYKNVTEKTALPNWHQFYIRFKFVRGEESDEPARKAIRRFEARWGEPTYSKRYDTQVVTEVFYYDYGEKKLEVVSYLRTIDGRRTYQYKAPHSATVLYRGKGFILAQDDDIPNSLPITILSDGILICRNYPRDPPPPGIDPNVVTWWPVASGRWVQLK